MPKIRTSIFSLSVFSALAATVQAAEPVYPKVRFTYTAQDVKNACAKATALAQRQIDRLARHAQEQRTFKNTVVGLERIGNRLDDAVGPFGLLAETSPNPAVQDAANDCLTKVSAFYVKTFARADLAASVQKVADLKLRLDLEDAKLLEETLRAFKRSGALLPDETRKQVSALRQQLAELQTNFAKNLAKANDYAELTHEELAGLPDDFIAGLLRTERGAYKLTLLDASSYVPFMENATNAAARKKVLTAHDRVAAAANLPLLEQAIALRDRIAKLMGFPSHAAYVLDAKMAGTPERVMEFLEELKVKLKPKAQADLAVLLARKQKDDPSATNIEMWDWRYYANQVKKEQYSVDDELIRQYFPVDHIIASVFALYQKLLGVTYVEIEPAYAWAQEVRLFEIRDAKTTELVGHFYLDLYPRANKYKHFAAFDFMRGRRNGDGSYTTPIAAVVGNFPKPVGDKPALLSHDDVETFFHEFGHIMHQTLTKARYSSLSGTNVRGDYVEAPSQMLENWAWDREQLKKLSRHYRTGEPLPEALIDKMVSAKHFNEGVYWSRQLMFATIDMAYHTAGEKVDTTALWNRINREIFLMDAPEGNAAQASFGHLMGGYDAGYYGYLWSKVYAQDMFTVFEQKGLESSEAGHAYRHWILEKGGTQEPDALIRGFLGREPSKDAFYRTLGLKPASDAASRGPGPLL